jgi:tetratricopeptide (TPR) repeat protein
MKARQNVAARPCPVTSFRTAAIAVVCVLAVAPLFVARAAGEGKTAADAVELYDAGQYAEAGRILTALDAEGKLDGSLLYRLYYCQRYANDPKSRETLERAIEPLEREAASSETLEPPFYLVNAYTNLDRPDDAVRAARAAVGRVESGAIDEPTDGLEQFRLGKLYVDAGKADAGEKWFAAALDSMTSEGQDVTKQAAYIAWAAGYLADAAFEREDYIAAADYYTKLFEAREPTMEGLDRLAVARARAGLYREAGQAWRRAELLDPANANEPRYRYRLVEAAGRMKNLSAVAPDDRLWSQLTTEELEQTIKEQVDEVRRINEEAQAASPLDGEARMQYQKRLDEARSYFVPAAIEFALRGNNLREAAFFGGYAPLIFKDSAWRVPRG